MSFTALEVTSLSKTFEEGLRQFLNIFETHSTRN